MERIQRRSVIRAAVSLSALLLPASAQATVLRGLSLRELVLQSHHVALLSGLDSRCVYVEIAGRRRIVTESCLRVDDVVSQAAPNGSELIVRTLGGKLGNEGELVHGQAEFALNQPCLAFLTRGPDESLWVTGMAQGHYPFDASASEPRLSLSPHLPTIRDWDRSAAHALAGQTVVQARRLVAIAEQP